MKFFAVFLSLVLLFLTPQYVNAIVAINKEVILEAQEYGVKRKGFELTDFLAPWLAYEEQAPVLNEFTERAYLYTPFLLIASDARDKTLLKQPVQLSDSEKILSDYAGCLVLSVTITGKSPGFADNSQVALVQDKKSVKPFQSVVNTPLKNGQAAHEQYIVHSYYYFSDKSLALNKPIKLVITAKDKQERRFYFDLSNFK